MPDHDLIGPWLRRFLTEYIVSERNLARNTRASYRDTFKLLLPFASRKVRKPIERLATQDLTSALVLKFLAHLEQDRGCSVRTRNQRLAAIRAFARFVGSRDPAHVEWCGHIRAIATKKAMSPPVGWLTRTEMEAMLAVPDRKTRRGQSEYALLLFLYNTGARVSEVTQLTVRDLTLDRDRGGVDGGRAVHPGAQDALGAQFGEHARPRGVERFGVEREGAQVSPIPTVPCAHARTGHPPAGAGAVVLVPAVLPSSAVAAPVLIVPAPLIDPDAVIVTPPDTAFVPAPPPLVFTAVVDRF